MTKEKLTIVKKLATKLCSDYTTENPLPPLQVGPFNVITQRSECWPQLLHCRPDVDAGSHVASRRQYDEMELLSTTTASGRIYAGLTSELRPGARGE